MSHELASVDLSSESTPIDRDVAMDSDSEDEPMMTHETDATTGTAPPQPVDLTLLGVLHHTRLHIAANPTFQLSSGAGRIALCAIFLGVVFGIGSQWALLSSTSLRQLGLYAMMMATFHILEFTWTAIFHPNKLSAACQSRASDQRADRH